MQCEQNSTVALCLSIKLHLCTYTVLFCRPIQVSTNDITISYYIIICIIYLSSVDIL